MDQRLTRRGFLRLGLGAAAGGAGILLAPHTRDRLARRAEAASVLAQGASLRYHLAGTDGWISLPSASSSTYHPDGLAPAGLSTYMFGFADVTGLDAAQIQAMKNKCQAPAPLMYFDEGQGALVRLTNLGLAQRPDLTDAHTIHWHGFRNVIPMFDGEPSSSVSVPIGRSLDYYYRPREPGTYMFHCHVEDTEHVHMGMTGIVFVRPAQNGGAPGIPPGRYVFNDGVPPGDPRSTAYDREFAVLLTEVWNEAHWDDAHIQLPEWSDYRPDFFLLNGRVYPDTILPHGTPPGRPDLAYQPYSSLIRANAGERVLLRFANLGFLKQTMVLDGIRLRVVGKDAVLLRGRDGSDLSYQTSTISIGPGESVDAIFVAPEVVSGEATYLLYNRNLVGLSNNGEPGLGGQLTEVRIAPAGTLPPQSAPNQ
ncbi:MAG: hypothetical protein OHK0015_51500 [Chloroflexi bacterium OHK40]